MQSAFKTYLVRCLDYVSARLVPGMLSLFILSVAVQTTAFAQSGEQAVDLELFLAVALHGWVFYGREMDMQCVRVDGPAKPVA